MKPLKSYPTQQPKRAESHLRLKKPTQSEIDSNGSSLQVQTDQEWKWISYEMISQSATQEYVFLGKGTEVLVTAYAQQALKQRPSPVTIDDHLIRACLSFTGKLEIEAPALLDNSNEQTLDQLAFELLAVAWIEWLRTGKEVEVYEVPMYEGFLSPDQKAHLAALYFWSKALQAAIKDDLVTAKVEFKKAIEVGFAVGLDSNPAFVWTYACTFLRAKRLGVSHLSVT